MRVVHRSAINSYRNEMDCSKRIQMFQQEITEPHDVALLSWQKPIYSNLALKGCTTQYVVRIHQITVKNCFKMWLHFFITSTFNLSLKKMF